MRAAPFFEPDASGGVLGPSLAGKRPKTDQNFNLDFSFLLRPPVSKIMDLWGAVRRAATPPHPTPWPVEPSGAPFRALWFANLRLARPDLREDKMINPAPGFWPIFGPLGPTAGPGSPGHGPGSKHNAGCTNNQPRRPILSPIRRHFFGGGTDRKNINI